MAYTRQYKKPYIKLDDNQNNKNEEKSEQSNSYYRRFYKRQNTDYNNEIKDNKNKKENIENKQYRFVYRRQYSINNTNEEKNTKKENSKIKYNNLHVGNLTSTSITPTIPITKDIRAPTTYASRGKIQQQKEIKQEDSKVKIEINNKKISDKMQETYNYEDSFSIAITDQNKIEESLNNFKKSNNIEEYYNMLLYYYPILSPKICQKHQIEKVKTEKEKFFDIVNDLIEKFGDKNKNKNLKESVLCEYVSNILEQPAIEELKKIKDKEVPSRWNYIYCKIVRFETETNEDLIFYNLSNDLLNNIKDNYRSFDIIYFLKEFMKSYEKLKYNNNLPNTIKKFIFLGLTNCEYYDDRHGHYLSKLDSIVNADNNKLEKKLLMSW